jgi:hypothetical protein
MWELLKDALVARGLQLSCDYLMADFEIAIRESFLATFHGVSIKGFTGPNSLLVDFSDQAKNQEFNNKNIVTTF